jgi:ribosomal protein S18 acetylase RimI-like enzyme
MSQTILYELEPGLSSAEYIDLLVRSTLADRRPVAEDDTIAGMLANTDIILSARIPDGLLVGISRAITDYSYCTYLADLAVDVAFQRRGIGRQMILRTHEFAGLDTSLILLSAPQAQTYYPYIGMQRHNSSWIVGRKSKSH